MRYDPLRYDYSSRRMTTYARKGAVCASQPLAAQAGLDMLKQGGNAIDAAVASAIALTVLEPVSNGIGGDLFSLVWTGGALHGLNASGPAPALADAAALRDAGHAAMPARGWIPVTVPGQVSGWRKLSERFGRLPFKTLFEPAVGYAEDGYAVTPVISRQWAQAFRSFREELTADCFKAWFDTFAPEGKAPAAGEVWRSGDHARTLRQIAESHGEAFYRGELACQIDACAREQGGWLRKEDLARYEARWVEPIRVRYRGYDVWEIPPNGHGLVVLMALGILDGMETDGYGTAETCHKQIEAMKLAFADGGQYIADPSCMTRTVGQLLSPSYLRRRRETIGAQAARPAAGDPQSGGTVYLCAADGEGNMISLIQSNYMGFGSGIVVPGTGIALHDRGANFSLDPRHANCLAPGKKPYHTIIPGFLTKNGRPVGPFGVMGAFMQPQGQVQVVMNTVDFHMNPQQALDAPRWQWVGDKSVEVEHTFPPDIAQALRERGHDVRVAAPDNLTFGRGQIIGRDESGVLAAATEPRADGCAAVW